MPIDPSIALRSQFQPVKSPTEAYGQAMTLRNLNQQGRMQDLQLQEAERDFNNYDQRMAQQDAIHQQEFDLNKLGIRSKQLEVGAQLADWSASILSGVKDPVQYQMARQQIIQKIPGAENELPEQYDPNVVQMKINESLDLSEQLALIHQNAVLEEQSRHNQAMEGRQQNSLAVRPVTVVQDGKPVVIDANTNNVIGDAPSTKTGGAMSATTQKELFEAEDIIESGQNAVDILNSILAIDPTTKKSQNDLAYEGGFPETRLAISKILPGSTESTDASVDLKNKVQGQALESLRAIFGGMPTEGERKILIELQGSLDMTAAQRAQIFKRAISFAEKRIAFNRKKADQLRKGEYFSEQAAPTEIDQSIFDQADAIINGNP